MLGLLLVSAMCYGATQVFQGNATGTALNVTGTVAVANGGTGATTLPANYLLMGNNTSPVAYASSVYQAPSTGNVLLFSTTDNATGKLQVNGNETITGGYLKFGSGLSTLGENYGLGVSSGDATHPFWVGGSGLVVGTTPSGGSYGVGSVYASGQLISTVATGTAPLQVTSTTPVANLSIGGNAATVTNGTFTTSLTNNGGAGVLAWPAAGATLTVPTGGGTLGSAAFTAASAYATSTQGTEADNAMPKAGGTFTGSVTMTDATNIIAGTTTGTKIGTATTQKLGFFNATPIVQPTGDVITALTNLGLVASPTIAASTATNLSGGAGGSIPYQSAANTTAFLANGSAGQMMRSTGGTTAPIWSTPTFPNTAPAGKILVGDGTNMVLSTPTFPNASATARKIIVSDGTNWVASTETHAAPGTVGNILISDGTNWVANASGPVLDAGGMQCTTMQFQKECYYAGAVANNGTVTLPSVTSGWSGQGEITIGADVDRATFTTNDTGTVNLVASSSGIVSNAATASKIQMGAVTPANPIVITNASGVSANIILHFRTK